MERWRHGAAFGGINGRCRVHRAEMLRTSGPCDLAEAEALRACDELRPWMRREFGWPLVELGNIRLRKGDLAGAEEAYLAAHDHAWSPQPGLALVRLAQGDLEGASALIADAIAHPFDVPSKERPPFGDLRLAPLLDAQAEIAAAAGDAGGRPDARRRSGRSPTRTRARSLDAAGADLARPSGPARDELDEAIDRAPRPSSAGPTSARRSRRLWPGRCSATPIIRPATWHGRRWSGARRTRCVRGVRRPRRAQTRARMPSPASRFRGQTSRRSPLRRADGATFSCDGDTRLVGFDGHTVLVRDLKGFRYLERLLAEPGREFHVLDLVAVERGTMPVDGLPRPSRRRRSVDGGSGLADPRRAGPGGLSPPARRGRRRHRGGDPAQRPRPARARPDATATTSSPS
jgi:hypothetical protein